MHALVTLLILVAQSPKKKDAEPAPPGYQVRTIQGFKLFVGDAVLAVPADKYKRPPLDVLEGELKTVAGLLKPSAVTALRTLSVWVEWERSEDGEPGRGRAVAIYWSGSPAAAARRGFHPGQANTVTVLNLKALTDEHQPDRDSGRCVLLHEFAHAVHAQTLPGGLDNLEVKAAYAGAVERKLYDRSQYAGTNPAEFFAELSCAYLDRLHYFPHTRDDLKKHDPAAHRLMTEVWGTAAVSKRKEPKDATKSDDGKSKFDLGVKLSEVRFGPPLFGPAFDPAVVSGRVVLVGYWGGSNTNLLDRLAALHAELGGYGLTVVGVNPLVGDPDDLRKPAEDRGVPFAVVRNGFVPEAGADKLVNQTPPHALLFGADGACLWRGAGSDADKPARAAVGRLLLGDAADTEVPKPLKPAVGLLKAGTPPLVALARLGPALTSADPAVKAAAKELADKLVAPAEAALDEAKGLVAADPVTAFEAAERLAVAGKGTGVGTRANALAEKLKPNPKVAAELRARTALAAVQKLAAQIGASADGDPADPRVRARLAGPVAQLQAAVNELVKKYPDSKAAGQAKRTAREWGLP